MGGTCNMHGGNDTFGRKTSLWMTKSKWEGKYWTASWRNKVWKCGL